MIETSISLILIVFILIDKDTPYDAEMALHRAPSYEYTRTTYKSGKVTLDIELNNPINIKEAEKLLDSAETEIKDNLSDDYTQKEALNGIIEYIKSNYTYGFSNGENNNFIKAYDTDRKMMCAQYSALTYLLCDRFGIEAKIIAGNDHIYNAIKLDTDSKYRAYDLAKTTYKILPAKVSYTDVITGAYAISLEPDKHSKAVGTALNERIDYTYSFTYQDASAILLIALIGTVIVLIVKRKTRHR